MLIARSMSMGAFLPTGLRSKWVRTHGSGPRQPYQTCMAASANWLGRQILNLEIVGSIPTAATVPGGVRIVDSQPTLSVLWR